MTDSEMHQARAGAERRKGDRRVAQLPYEGPDRRTGERRTGIDRRAAARLKLSY